MDVNDTIRLFTEFIRTIDFSDQLDKAFLSDSTVLITRGDQTIVLTGEDADKYTELKSSMYEAVSKRRPVSRRAIDGILDDFFMRVLASGDHRQNLRLVEQLKSQVQELKSALFEQPKNWEVRLIVEGLAPSGLPLKVGKVDFQHLNEAVFMELRGYVGEFAQKSDGDQQAEEQRLLKEIEVLRGKTIAVSSVNAVDRDAAIETSRRGLQTTIDAINFFASRDNLGGWVFVPGDTIPQTELVLASCEGSKLHLSYERAGPRRCIPLNQIANRKGFARVSEILNKETPSGLEERILSSLQWAGRAQVERRREEAFLLYAIALESLILGKDTTAEITHQLATRCAHLGGGPSLEEKRFVVEKIRSLYGIRSKIVHSGNFQVSEAELALIREYAVLSLFIVIDMEPFRSMTGIDDLERWFEAQLLTGGIRQTRQ